MKTAQPAKSKLTLSIDADLIEYGKRVAKRQGTSLSALLQAYLEERRRGDEEAVEDIMALGKQLGKIEVPRDILELIPDPPRPMPDIPLDQLRREYHEAYAKRKNLD